MSFAGDFAVESTIDIKFTTRRFTTGAPFTLAGSPVISAYPDNSTTQLTAGITLSVDFDSVTGLHNVRVVATVANGYAAGSSYYLVITTGTVDSVSVVGEVVGSFTLGRGAAFGRLGAPAGASVSADIAAIEGQTDDIGAAGAGLTAVPWNAAWDAEVQSEVADALSVYDPPTNAEMEARTIAAANYATAAALDTVDNFLDTEIATIVTAVAAIEVDTQDIQSRIPAALTAGGNIKADSLAISGSTESADRLERSTLAIVTGTIGSGSTTTSIVASSFSPASSVNDQWNGRILIFDKDTTTAALRGQATDISDYVHATLTMTVTALTTAPASGDTFTIT